ncbi:probable ubiquitin-conjugating enzyme E2 24 isoform X2 [Amborella trichopoda]|uniref:probable ubiquitin-conjugating enzyme E2 24 isoform X2 n=1 Tax=Amborella trichopoda TaxID=13333 RepID=UPI0005D40715|nr:probable ubiquitin-conjugating enzyme E2 24 isoform X2 [Amborella trichopoda]|eukprot:XP_011624445.1 probable ubiquitin-conjugating enzyme E2 24 isoform X2 [Amborella trichopoda]
MSTRIHWAEPSTLREQNNLINMVFGDFHYESYSSSSDSEDHNDLESLYSGYAQSILSCLDESIEKIDDFLSFDQGFSHGDIVYYVMDPSGQTGRVVDVNIIVDLETMSGEILKDVNGKELVRVMPFAAGDFVIHGPWLGKVERVVDLVTVLFDDGAKCAITGANPKNLVPIYNNLLEDAQFPYHPGQRVQSMLPSVFKNAKWLCGAWDMNHDEGMVCEVNVDSVYVKWVASIVASYFSSLKPPCLQDPKNLTLLSSFWHDNWQLGDWCNLRSHSSCDYDSTKESIEEKVKRSKIGKGPLNGDYDYEQALIIVKRRTKVDVIWQDGKHTAGIDSQNLLRISDISDHEFWPEQFVLEKGTDEDGQDSIDKRAGVVKNVDTEERTARVIWLNPELSNGSCNSNNTFGKEEVVSVYELVEHPDYSYCPGEIVFKLIPYSEALKGSSSIVRANGQNQSLGISKLAKQVIVSSELSECCWQLDKSYLTHIGIVVGIKDGSIEVAWASGDNSKVGPHEIVGIDRHEDLSSTPILCEDDYEKNTGKGMLDFEKYLDHKEEKKDVMGSGQDRIKDAWSSSALLFPRTAFGFLTNIASSLFGHRGSTSLSSTKSLQIENIDNSCSVREEDSLLQSGSEFSKFHQAEDVECWDPKIKVGILSVKPQVPRQQSLEMEIDKKDQGQDGFEIFISLRQFDTVSDYSDHHFIDGLDKGQNVSQMKRSWIKKVHQEWTILEKGLPNTIYVRAYEDRMDLFRAAIVGAAGTPYHDGLFFFDIALPADYPYQPPSVHYHSGGLRLNPNLYESGKVCLSLLNTWSGSETEVWKPDSSTLLQVLISLQALVLNSKPYFNEAGYETYVGKAEAEKNSLSYNENAFLLSCKSMLNVLRKPPKHFEQLVKVHFQVRAKSILDACQSYMDGAKVGSCGLTGANKSSSAGFKMILSKLFPKLVSVFASKGAIDPQLFLENTGEESTQPSLSP